MVPNATSVPKHVGKEKLWRYCVAFQQNARAPRHWMTTELAVIAVVFSPELTLCCLAKLGWGEKRLTLLAVAAQPHLTIAVSRRHSPGQVLDLHHLSKQSGSRIRAPIHKEICTRGYELSSDSKQRRHSDGLIVSVPER